MSYTPTEWKTGDVITAEKLNNMESGIVAGQNNVEFVKLITLTNVRASKGDTGTGSGGSLPDNKTLGDLIGSKTVIGLTSMYRYDPTGESSSFNSKSLPVDTQLFAGFYPMGLWELPNHMEDKSITVSVFWGSQFNPAGSVSAYYGELDVYAICI